MTPSFHPEPPPQNDLERLMRKAADDPALEGRMWRMMWESELYTFIPDHPEMHGEHPLVNGDQFTSSIYPHEQGEFIAVFTSEAAAEWAGEQIPGTKPAIASMPAEALFKIANDGKTWVRINHGLRATVVLNSAAVAALVSARGGTHANPRAGAAAGLTLVDALAVEFPAQFLEAIRRFCDEQRWALGVYAFFTGSDTSSAVHYDDVRLVVWLRSAENNLLEEFQVMVNAVTPGGQRVTCTGATSDRADIVEFLQSRTPIWPVV